MFMKNTNYTHKSCYKLTGIPTGCDVVCAVSSPLAVLSSGLPTTGTTCTSVFGKTLGDSCN